VASEIFVEVVIKIPVEACLEYARQGSLDSLGQAFELCRPFLIKVATDELGADLRAKVDVSDLVQETFLEAFRDFEQFTGKTKKEWKAWLRTILKHNLLHVVRRYRESAMRDLAREVGIDQGDSQGVQGGDLVADSTSPSGRAMREERNAGLQRAIERLPKRDRLVLLLKFQEQCTFEEMGRRLGCSGAMAHKRWSAAIDRLRLNMNSY
jgi:RNA polymerase sigma-70 factor, ECF subfamily